MSVIVFLFSALLGATLFHLGLRTSLRPGALLNRTGTVNANSIKQLGGWLLKLAHVVFINVILPIVRFFTTICVEVRRNISPEIQLREVGAANDPGAVAGEGAISLPTESEAAVEAAPPTHRSFAQFCAALISTVLATAIELTSRIRRVLADTFGHYLGSARTYYSTSPFIVGHYNNATPSIRMDMYDEPDADRTTAVFDVPGVAKDAVDISLHEGTLTVSYQSGSLIDTESVGRVYHTRERPQWELTRMIKLPVSTKATDLHASMENGVLTISFPRTTHTVPEKITLE